MNLTRPNISAACWLVHRPFRFQISESIRFLLLASRRCNFKLKPKRLRFDLDLLVYLQHNVEPIIYRNKVITVSLGPYMISFLLLVVGYCAVNC
jgi:hypothetical protein